MKQTEIIRRIEALAVFLIADCRIARSGVPHIIIKDKRNMIYSITFFAKTGSWRIFYPYPALNQNRVTFNNALEVLEYFLKLGHN